MIETLSSQLIVPPSAYGVDGEVLIANVDLRSPTEAVLETDGAVLTIRTDGLPVRECLDTFDGWIGDILVSKSRVHDRADLLLLRRSLSGPIVLMFVTGSDGAWYADAVAIERDLRIDVSHTLSRGDEQIAGIVANHRHFVRLTAGLVSSRDRESPAAGLLRVKVDPRELWFLRFAFGAFARLGLDGFDGYAACQLIVTSRSVSQIAERQRATEHELANTAAFLDGTQIVLNTYREHASASSAPRDEAAMAVLIEVLETLQELAFPPITHGLRWTLNPPADELRRILLSKETRFLFADFEAAGGVWSLGDGEHRCATACEHPRNERSPLFDLESLRGRLSHVRLMRVFHCNSLFDPYAARTQPADPSSLGAALLATDAFFVEGSFTEEPVIDFYCSLLASILGRADVQTMLFAKSLAGTCDIASLTAKANTLLSERGFPTMG